MSSRLAIPVLAVFALVAAACGGGDAPEPETPAEAPAAEPASAPVEGPRVFFMQPQDGDTVTLPLEFVFANDMFEISPVPEGDVTEPRPAVGHYHLGIDTGCVPVGTVIPQGDPSWVHFGTGNDRIEYEAGTLAPGPHMFTVQAGDDLHQAIEGLCETIEITVEG